MYMEQRRKSLFMKNLFCGFLCFGFLINFSYISISASGSLESFVGVNPNCDIDAIAFRNGYNVSDPYKQYLALGGDNNSFSIYSLDTSSPSNGLSYVTFANDFRGDQLNALDWDWRTGANPYLVIGVNNSGSYYNSMYAYSFNPSTDVLAKEDGCYFSTYDDSTWHWPWPVPSGTPGDGSWHANCDNETTIVYDVSYRKSESSTGYVVGVAKIPNYWGGVFGADHWRELRVFKVDSGGNISRKKEKLFKPVHDNYNIVWDWYQRYATTVSWNPTSDFIAVGGAGALAKNWEDPLLGAFFPMKVRRYYGLSGDNNVLVYAYSTGSNTLTEKGGVRFDPDSWIVRAVDWSPDGQYLAVGIDEASEGDAVEDRCRCYIYEVNASTGEFTFSGMYLLVGYGNIGDLRWAKSDYILLGLTNPGGCAVLSFDGSDINLTATISYPLNMNSVDWSSGGRYVAASSQYGTGKEVNAASFTAPADDVLDSINTVAWRNESWNGISNNFTSTIAVSGNKKSFKMYSYAGSTTINLGTDHARNISNQEGDFTDAANVNSLEWSTNGKYLAVVGETNSVDFPAVQVYSFASYGDIPDRPYAEAFWGGTWHNRYNYGANIRDVAWNKPSNLDDDPTYLAIVGEYDSAHEKLTVYQLSGSSLTEKDTEDYGTNGPVNCVGWRPGQNQILVGGFNIDGSSEIILYDFNGTSLSVNSTKGFTSTSAEAIRTFDWHPTGNYVAVAFIDRVYVLDSSLTEVLLSPYYLQLSDGAHFINSVKWDSEGELLLVGLESDPEEKLCEFDSTATPTLTLFRSIGKHGDEIKSVDWAVGSRYRVVGGLEDGEPRVTEWEFSETVSLSKIDTADCNPTSFYIAVGEDKPTLEIRSISGETASSLESGNVSRAETASIKDVCWSPCGRYIAAGTKPADGYYSPLVIYEFDGTNTSYKSESYCMSYSDFRASGSSMITSVDWHIPNDPVVDTLYIAAIGNCINDSNGLIVHSLTENTLSVLSIVYFDSLPSFVRWQPYSNYFSVGGYNIDGTEDIKIYKFDTEGETVTEVFGESWWASSPGASSFSWSYDGNYFAVSSSSTLSVGHFDASNPDSWSYSGTDTFVDCGAAINFVRWSNNNLYIIVGCDNGVTFEVQVYFFDGRNSIQLIDRKEYSGDASSVGWVQDAWYYYWVGDVDDTVHIEQVLSGETVSLSKIDTVDCDPRGFYIAVGEDKKTLEIRYVNGEAVSLLEAGNVSRADTAGINEVRWSPCGRYVAVGLQPDDGYFPPLTVYEFDGTNTTVKSQSYCNSSLDFRNSSSGMITSLDWNTPYDPMLDALYVAAVGNCINDSAGLVIHSLTENTLPILDSDSFDSVPTFLRWQPYSNYFAVGGYNIDGTKDIKIYKFDTVGETVTEVFGESWWGSSPGASSFDWSDNNDFVISSSSNLFVGNFDTSNPNSWSYSGTYASVDCGAIINFVKWSKNGLYVIAGCDSGTTSEVQVYFFDDRSTLKFIDSKEYSGSVSSVGWSQDDWYCYWAGDLDDEVVVEKNDFERTWTGVVGHNIPKNALAFSPNTNEIVFIDDSGELKLKSLDFQRIIFEEISTASLVFGSNQSYFDVSPNGSFIAAVGYNFQGGGNKELQLFDATSNELSSLFTLTVSDLACSVDWSSNGEFIVVANENNEIHIYELSGTSFTEKGTGISVDTTCLYTAKWSPCGRYVAAGLRNGDPSKYNLIIYEFDGNDLTAVISEKIGSDYNTATYELDWSVNGKYLALGGRRMNVNPDTTPIAHEVRVYEFDPTVPSIAYKDGNNCSGDGIVCVHWNPDCEYLAATGYEGWTQLFYFDGTTLTQTGNFDIGDPGCEVRWDPKGNYLIVCQQGDGGGSQLVEFYKFARNSEELNLTTTFTIISDAESSATVRWYPMGDKFSVLGQSILKSYNWNGEISEQLSGMAVDYGTQAWSVKWNPINNNYLAVGGTEPTDGKELKVFYFDSNKTLTLLRGCNSNYGDAIYSVDWAPNGYWLAVGGYSPTNNHELQVYRFNSQSSLALTTSAEYGDSIYSVAWSSDGNYLAVGGSGSNDGAELHIYSMNTQDYLYQVTGANYGNRILEMDWSSDSQYLALAGGTPDNGNELQIYSFDSTTSTLSYLDGKDFGAGDSYETWAVAWSPDGDYVAVGGENDGRLKIYYFDGSDLSDAIIDENLGASIIHSISWSPCGNYLSVSPVSPTNEHEIQIYLFNGTSIRLITSLDYGNSGSGAIDSDWSSDGNYMAVAGFNPTDGREVKIYPVSWLCSNIQAQEGSESVVDLEMSDVKIDISKYVSLENIRLRVK